MIKIHDSEHYRKELDEIIDECISLKKTDKLQAMHIAARIYTLAEFGIMSIADYALLHDRIKENFDYSQDDNDEIIK